MQRWTIQLSSKGKEEQKRQSDFHCEFLWKKTPSTWAELCLRLRLLWNQTWLLYLRSFCHLHHENPLKSDWKTLNPAQLGDYCSTMTRHIIKRTRDSFKLCFACDTDWREVIAVDTSGSWKGKKFKALRVSETEFMARKSITTDCILKGNSILNFFLTHCAQRELILMAPSRFQLHVS